MAKAEHKEHFNDKISSNSHHISEKRPLIFLLEPSNNCWDQADGGTDEVSGGEGVRHMFGVSWFTCGE